MSEFNGVTILVLGDGGLPRRGGADVSVRHIPGGDTTYVDIGGRQLQTLTLSLLFLAAADALAFEAQAGQVGTLVTPDGTRTALLVSTQRTARGLGGTGDTTLSCEFQLL